MSSILFYKNTSLKTRDILRRNIAYSKPQPIFDGLHVLYRDAAGVRFVDDTSSSGSVSAAFVINKTWSPETV